MAYGFGLRGIAWGFVLAAGLLVPLDAWAIEVECSNEFGSCTVSNDPVDFMTCSCDDTAGTGGTGASEWAGLTEEELMAICVQELDLCAPLSTTGSTSAGTTTVAPTTTGVGDTGFATTGTSDGTAGGSDSSGGGTTSGTAGGDTDTTTGSGSTGGSDDTTGYFPPGTTAETSASGTASASATAGRVGNRWSGRGDQRFRVVGHRR